MNIAQISKGEINYSLYKSEKILKDINPQGQKFEFDFLSNISFNPDGFFIPFVL